jgi:hypothetical protein
VIVHDVSLMYESVRMKIKAVLSGAAILVAVVSFVTSRIDSLLGTALQYSNHKKSIFGAAIASFYPAPLSAPIALKSPFGIIASRSFSVNETVMFLADETTNLVLDGSIGVPFQLMSISEFDSLTSAARATLSISLHRVMSDEFTGPLSTLWRSVGVRPLPDVRWARHRGLFSIPFNHTGIEEIDHLLERGRRVVKECTDFIKSNSRYLPSALTEQEIRWAWIFLNLYGVTLNDQKVLIAPLVFTRRTMNTSRSIMVKRDTEGIYISALRKIERGDELLIDGSDEISDGFAFLFHGSWIADNSVHRGRFWLRLAPGDHARISNLKPTNCSDSDGLLAIWLSNDEKELQATREKIYRCSKQYITNNGQGHLSQGREARALSLVVGLLKREVEQIYRPDGSEDMLAPIRFQYFNLLYNELFYWENRKANFTLSRIEL